jgi:hypothetical protein
MTGMRQTPPAPCGYCRRCLLHDDPAGCLEVERWERENTSAQNESRGTHPVPRSTEDERF